MRLLLWLRHRWMLWRFPLLTTAHRQAIIEDRFTALMANPNVPLEAKRRVLATLKALEEEVNK